MNLAKVELNEWLVQIVLLSYFIHLSLCAGLTKEVATLVLAIVVGLFTVVGGIGGSIYVAYFSCAIMMSIVMVYFAEVFYNPLNHTDNKYGSANKIFDIVQCGRADKDNDDSSLMTFLSRGGMLEGIIIILSAYRHSSWECLRNCFDILRCKVLF